jgi:hypothetical protein
LDATGATSSGTFGEEGVDQNMKDMPTFWQIVLILSQNLLEFHSVGIGDLHTAVIFLLVELEKERLGLGTIYVRE